MMSSSSKRGRLATRSSSSSSCRSAWFLSTENVEAYHKYKACKITSSKMLNHAALNFEVLNLFASTTFQFLLTLAFPYNSELLLEFLANLTYTVDNTTFHSFICLQNIEITRANIAQYIGLSTEDGPISKFPNIGVSAFIGDFPLIMAADWGMVKQEKIEGLVVAGAAIGPPSMLAWMGFDLGDSVVATTSPYGVVNCTCSWHRRIYGISLPVFMNAPRPSGSLRVTGRVSNGFVIREGTRPPSRQILVERKGKKVVMEEMVTKKIMEEMRNPVEDRHPPPSGATDGHRISSNAVRILPRPVKGASPPAFGGKRSHMSSRSSSRVNLDPHFIEAADQVAYLRYQMVGITIYLTVNPHILSYPILNLFAHTTLTFLLTLTVPLI
ncbi:hypothetical protein MA16_Dca024298 [Dendrobium catenatum]|uniref:Uncharacterized protein n=1 Tax=Dendrobium catenatum TaxID=906689 RepID=A0A2I0VC89_9ASPA|nr:hypothetical protein MA16_Dca024298 [Dendrobium catenatum]